MASYIAPILYSNTAITTALTAVVGNEFPVPENCTSLNIQYTHVDGGTGTSVTAWVQTSIDDTNWVDVSCFDATATGRKVSTVNGNVTHVLAEATDGALADNTDLDGWIGSKIRVKVTTVGTYDAVTSLVVHCKYGINGIGR